MNASQMSMVQRLQTASVFVIAALVSACGSASSEPVVEDAAWPEVEPADVQEDVASEVAEDTAQPDAGPVRWCADFAAKDFCADFDDGALPAAVTLEPYVEVAVSKRSASRPWGMHVQAPGTISSSSQPRQAFARVVFPKGGSSVTFDADLFIVKPLFREPSDADPGDNGGIELVHIENRSNHFALHMRRSVVELELRRYVMNSSGGLTSYSVVERVLPLPRFATWVHLSIAITASTLRVQLGPETVELAGLMIPPLPATNTLLLFGADGWPNSPSLDLSYDNVVFHLDP